MLIPCLVYAPAATLSPVDNTNGPATVAGWRKVEMVRDQGLQQMTSALGHPMNAITQPGCHGCARFAPGRRWHEHIQAARLQPSRRLAYHAHESCGSSWPLLLLADPSREKVKRYLPGSTCYAARQTAQFTPSGLGALIGVCVLQPPQPERDSWELMNMAVSPPGSAAALARPSCTTP